MNSEIAAQQLRTLSPDFGPIANILAQDDQFMNAETLRKRVEAVWHVVESGGLPTMEPLLPLFLNLDGKPYSLERHQPFAPLFRFMMPKSQIWLTGRQLGKTRSTAASGVLLSTTIPNFKQMFLTPLYEQIRNFSNVYVRPFINQSPLRSLWTGTSTENSVLSRSFLNDSRMIFSFCLLDADRVRGRAVDRMSIDEIQDFDPDHLPVVAECLSASSWDLRTFTGTPKSLDNPAEGLYSSSSMAEWFIRCRTGGCNEWNIPAKEYHLLKMIGPYHDEISAEIPATVCHKCSKPIFPQDGHWVHRKPELRWKDAGYHVPQIIMPLHYASADKWSALLMKQQGYGNMTEAKFWNEVLGVSIDAGQKLISETELKAAATLPWKNNPKSPDPQALTNPGYLQRVMAVDWGGGGDLGVSFTVIAILGLRPTGTIDILWGKRLVLGGDKIAEAKEVLHWFNQFSCSMMIHDYSGAGADREVIIAEKGLPPERMLPIKLVRAAMQDLMKYHGPTAMNHRPFYTLDKTRSLQYTCQAIRTKMVQSFQWDRMSKEEPGLLGDFLALVEDKAETRLGGDVYMITRNPMLPDDFAQAVNIGCCGLWHMHQNWPNFTQAIANNYLDQQTLEAAGNRDHGWENDRSAFRPFA